MVTEFRFKRIFEPDIVVTSYLQGSLEEFQHEDSSSDMIDIDGKKYSKDTIREALKEYFN